MQAAAASDPGCAPNVITYSALMTACCAGGRPDAAQQVFRSMRAAGVQPDHITYSTLLAGAAPRRPGRRWRHRALLERARLPRRAPGAPRAVGHSQKDRFGSHAQGLRCAGVPRAVRIDNIA